MTIDELKAEALRLNPEERAELAAELLVSLGISFHEDARTEFDEATDFYGVERASLGVAPPRYNHPARQSSRR